jgi:hypothetical protein
MLKKMLLLTTLSALLAACLPSQQPAVDVQAEVNTAVAGTMQANEQIDRAVEQTVAAKEIAQPTQVPTDVEVVLQVTNTPFVIPTSTPTATLAPPKYSCYAITRKPSTNQVMNGGQDFDIKWTITNTGTAAWYDAVDIKYYSGVSMATTKRYEIRRALEPGQSFDVVLDAKAPNSKGPHFMAWMVEGGMCFAYVTVWVK